MSDPAAAPTSALALKEFLVPVFSFLGAWIAARFALGNFFVQRVWERKTAAYSAIFEALHHIGRWYEKQYKAVLVRQEIDEPTLTKLRAEANKSEDDLELKLASETWLIPTDCRALLEKMMAELKNAQHKHTMWEAFLEDGCFIIKNTTDNLRQMVQKDLKLNTPWYRRVFQRSIPPPKKWNDPPAS